MPEKPHASMAGRLSKSSCRGESGHEPRPASLVPAGKKLRDELASAAQMAVDMLIAWPPGEFLNAPATDLTDRLVRLATFRVPALVRSQAYLEPPGEITVPGEQVGRPVRTAVVTRFTLAVPIAGQASLLRMSASTASAPVAAYGAIDEQAGVLRLHCDGLHNPVAVKDYFERQLDQLDRLLSETQVAVVAHNQQMTEQLRTAVIQRKAKLLSDRNIQAGIGYAIKRRPDAETYSVPIMRSRVVPQPRRATSAGPTPMFQSLRLPTQTTRQRLPCSGTLAMRWNAAPV